MLYKRQKSIKAPSLFSTQIRLLFLALILLFALGIFFGALGVNTLAEEHIKELTRVIDSFTSGISQLNISAPGPIRSVLADNIITWVLIFLLGLTVIGIPLVLILVFMRGFTLGFAISFLARQKSGSGLLLAVTAIAPHNLILLPALFISGVAAISFTLLLIQRFFNTRTPILPGFFAYAGVMLAAGILFSGAALIEVYITPWLTRTAAKMLAGGWPF